MSHPTHNPVFQTAMSALELHTCEFTGYLAGRNILHATDDCYVQREGPGQPTTLTGSDLLNIAGCRHCYHNHPDSSAAAVTKLHDLAVATHRTTSHISLIRQTLNNRSQQRALRQPPFATLVTLHTQLHTFLGVRDILPDTVHDLARHLHQTLAPQVQALQRHWADHTDATLWHAPYVLPHLNDSRLLHEILNSNLTRRLGEQHTDLINTFVDCYTSARTTQYGFTAAEQVLYEAIKQLRNCENLPHLIDLLDTAVADEVSRWQQQPTHIIALTDMPSRILRPTEQQLPAIELLRQHGIVGTQLDGRHLLEVDASFPGLGAPDQAAELGYLDIGPSNRLDYTPEGLQTASRLFARQPISQKPDCQQLRNLLTASSQALDTTS